MIKALSEVAQQETVVGENVLVTGKLQTSSNIQINGRVKGEIDSGGSVVVGKAAMVEGPISAAEIKVEGVVNGNITAKESLELDVSAKVFGEIKTKTLSVQPGAIFVGKCVMGETSKKEERTQAPKLKESEKTESKPAPEPEPEPEPESEPEPEPEPEPEMETE